MQHTTKTTKTHAFIDGVLLGLSLSDQRNSKVVEKFFEVCENADPDLADFARANWEALLADRAKEIMDTFEVIYFTD